MKSLQLKESYTQYTVTRNVYGDEVLTKVGTGLCMYRNITSELQNNNREEVNIVGTFHFAASDVKNKGDVIGYSGQLYRVEQVTVGKELLTSNAVHFYKCQVSLLRQVS